MKLGLLTTGLIGMLALTGCAFNTTAPFSPPSALVVTSTTAPLTTEFNATQAANLKHGSATTKNILGIVSVGDCSLQTAAREGGLNTIEFADYSNFNILGVYQETTVTVYGK